MSTVNAAPSQEVSFSVSLRSAGQRIAGTQSDITFDSTDTPIAAKSDGRPDCTVNPAINKNGTAFAFVSKFDIGSYVERRGLRALVLATDNVDPIPDGSVLFTCKANIAPTASGIYPLTISDVVLATPDGQAIADEVSVGGAIVVGTMD